MSERSPVFADVEESGLIDSLPSLYGMVLRAMAELADISGGREVAAAHVEIARRAGLPKHPEEVKMAIENLIEAGILENGDSIRIVSRPRLDEKADQLRKGQIGLTSIGILKAIRRPD